MKQPKHKTWDASVKSVRMERKDFTETQFDRIYFKILMGKQAALKC